MLELGKEKCFETIKHLQIVGDHYLLRECKQIPFVYAFVTDANRNHGIFSKVQCTLDSQTAISLHG